MSHLYTYTALLSLGLLPLSTMASEATQPQPVQSETTTTSSAKPINNGIVSGPGLSGPVKRPGKPGYDQPNQYIHLKPIQVAPNMEPVILHPDQMKEAQEKLAALQKKRVKGQILLFF